VGGDLDGVAAHQLARQQVALEREGGGVLAGVLARVVQAQRGAGAEFLGEEEVVPGERRPV
jgi:hypothetical protein